MFYLLATKSHTFILSHFLLLSLMNCPSSCCLLSQIKMSLGFLSSSSYDLITLFPFTKKKFLSCFEEFLHTSIPIHSLALMNHVSVPITSLKLYLSKSPMVCMLLHLSTFLVLTLFNTFDHSLLFSWFPWHHTLIVFYIFQPVWSQFFSLFCWLLFYPHSKCWRFPELSSVSSFALSFHKWPHPFLAFEISLTCRWTWN